MNSKTFSVAIVELSNTLNIEKRMFIITEVNGFSENEFIIIFGNIIEHYPQVANYLYAKLPIENIERLCVLAQDYLGSLTIKDKECVLKLHPDLAEMGNLTSESSEEQNCAGLNTLTSEDKIRMGQLNNEYKTKFGFPFVICARENKVPAIFRGLEERLQNTRARELEMGIEEVKKICTLRILQIVS